MRKHFISILVLVFTAANLFSQSESDSGLYNKGLFLLDKSRTAEDYVATAGYFEKLSAGNPSHWLADYYAALAYILAGQRQTDNKKRDAMLDKAQPFIDKSFARRNGEPELYVLQAFLYQVRLQADPQGRSISLSQKAETSLKKAIEADSTNPRAYFLMANNIYYTPPMFKGGPKNALPVFLKARDKFRNYKASLTFLPDWGQQQNEEMIKVCNSAKN